MDKLSYRCHRFPSIVIQQAVWLYFRFALSYRDVEDMLAERGIDVSYETVRRWALKFGGIIARKLRRGRPRPDGRWHLDEVFVSINGRQLYVWRAVDSEGVVLDLSFPKIPSVRIRAMRENQSIIRRDACHPPPVSNRVVHEECQDQIDKSRNARGRTSSPILQKLLFGTHTGWTRRLVSS